MKMTGGDLSPLLMMGVSYYLDPYIFMKKHLPYYVFSSDVSRTTTLRKGGWVLFSVGQWMCPEPNTVVILSG